MFAIEQTDRRWRRAAALVALVALLVATSARMEAQTGCNPNPTPFTDLGNMPSVFCQAVASVYFTGITAGATATTYEPLTTVNRGQMAAFLSRTHDSALRRGSPRAALGLFWNLSKDFLRSGDTAMPSANLLQSDGEDVYVALGPPGNQVVRLRARNAFRIAPLSTYGIQNPFGIVIAPESVYVTSNTSPGRVIAFLRGTGSHSPGGVFVGNGPTGIAYDGERIWTANTGGNSVSIYTPSPINVVTVPGFASPLGILYDGSHIWVTTAVDTLVKLDASGNVLQTVAVGDLPGFPMFDGTNLWVPNSFGNSLTVVRVKDANGNPLATAFPLTTLTGNGLNGPQSVAFDGQRVMVTNFASNSLSLWKATDLTPLGSISTDRFNNPFGVCSDGVDFWVSFRSSGQHSAYVKF